MVASIIRESAFGQTLRLLSGKRLFKYPEEVNPEYWQNRYGAQNNPDPNQSRRSSRPSRQSSRQKSQRTSRQQSSSSLEYGREQEKDAEKDESDEEDDTAPAPFVPRGPNDQRQLAEQRQSALSHTRGSDSSGTRVGDGDKDGQEKSKGKDEKNAKNDDDAEKGRDYQLVDWEENDAENPLNWSTRKKVFVTFEICLMTFAIYIGSAIYSAGELSLAKEFNIDDTAATLGLTLFVAGYGCGPLILSPLSEIPQIGRNPVYIITLILFVILNVPTALSVNLGMFLAFRFMTGFVGSPVLATGGATLADMYRPKYRAFSIGIWGAAAVCGPTMGPLVGGWAAMFEGWRWTIWELVWLSGFALAFLIFFLPETSANNLLYRRTARLRKITGNDKLKCQPEIQGENMTGKDILLMTLVRPISLNFTEPMVFLLNLYIALIYGLLYVWFESFEIVFVETYGFNLGEEGLSFLGILIGTFVVIPPFFWYLKKYTMPKFNENGELCPEERLPPAFFGGPCIVICLFWFGWSSGRTHWIVPIIGSGFFSVGTFLLFNSVLNYLGDAYPDVAASVLAGNDFFRSMFGAGFPLFARAMFDRLGVDWASSLLGFLALTFVPIPWVLYKYGGTLRKNHSKFARKDL